MKVPNNYSKEIKNAPPKYNVVLYKHAGFFKNTREVLEKHDLQVNAVIWLNISSR